MNCSEFAKRLNVSINTFRAMRDTGMLPPFVRETPKRYCWTDEQVDLFVSCCPRTIAEYNRRKGEL